MEPPPPPGPPLPVGPPGIEPPPPPGPPLPVGPPGTEPPPEVSPGTDDVGAGAVLVVELVVVVVVVLLLVEPPPPPHPTASASIATPPSSAIITLDSDFISYPLSACRATDTPGAGARNSRTVRGILTARNADSSSLPGGAWRNTPSGSRCRAGFSGWSHRTPFVTNAIRASICRSTYAGSDATTGLGLAENVPYHQPATCSEYAQWVCYEMRHRPFWTRRPGPDPTLGPRLIPNRCGSPGPAFTVAMIAVTAVKNCCLSRSVGFGAASVAMPCRPYHLIAASPICTRARLGARAAGGPLIAC
jgi:hypothetical protein